MTRPIRAILVANRGEIAVRVMKTAKRLGIRAIAVYSEADAGAMHVRTADEAVRIGPAPARDSYLAGDRVLEAARIAGADAVHPGYGFLSENAEFAEAVEAAGLAWIGPPPEAIRAMGSKSAAKALMEKAKVPLVPGYHGADQDPDTLTAAADRIGYPVLIKASAGGGGKGMKIVEASGDFPAALASAKREAMASFGDDRVLVERYLTAPRHVEVQVFADGLGNTIHLFERDCSIQRRHQKVIEEAPAPNLSDRMRAEMGAAAVAAARAVGYVGAGTVEFITEENAFYFMEMNTRLQVEHPVTEAITGLDLVEWQIRVAAGEPLPLDQKDVRCQGHAVEARLYAEDPDRDFVPQVGRLRRLAFPDGVRIDAGVEVGDTVSHHYDPMIAKLIAHGPDREGALARLSAALDATKVVGVTTNRRLLARIVDHPAFRSARFDTGFIDRHRDELLAPSVPAETLDFQLAALAVRAARTAVRRIDPSDPYSPFATAGAYNPNLPAMEEITLSAGGVEQTLRFETEGGRTVLAGDSERLETAATLSPEGQMIATLGRRRLQLRVHVEGDEVVLLKGAEPLAFRVLDPWRGPATGTHAVDRVLSPMPGAVVALMVSVGDQVERGAPLVVVEAMKMEHVLRAPHDGVVAFLGAEVGYVVDEGVELVIVEAT
ncbi:acetyl/propionyl/methylcrotonyl-CoA carboxylase subunit alpha [Chthonobacter albigriseus]|uniref:acetyl/propionyl/methylcrotonyl-CoA carboxylase subunit alpha n=1 Tax=Chthonobacter albigriseus TaxID=1683161 RepID=UPI0015EE483A|nr:acetyl-CoA carboxylase biotin carboxylase subunit [Chthonobacter albigriseus]